MKLREIETRSEATIFCKAAFCFDCAQDWWWRFVIIYALSLLLMQLVATSRHLARAMASGCLSTSASVQMPNSLHVSLSALSSCHPSTNWLSKVRFQITSFPVSLSWNRHVQPFYKQFFGGTLARRRNRRTRNKFKQLGQPHCKG